MLHLHRTGVRREHGTLLLQGAVVLGRAGQVRVGGSLSAGASPSQPGSSGAPGATTRFCSTTSSPGESFQGRGPKQLLPVRGGRSHYPNRSFGAGLLQGLLPRLPPWLFEYSCRDRSAISGLRRQVRDMRLDLPKTASWSLQSRTILSKLVPWWPSRPE